MAIGELKQREAEISALLESANAVTKYPDFKDSARSIFDSCKNLIGASAGYVALLNQDGTENEVLFLDSGGLPCTVDPYLPMPIRGLRSKACSSGRAVYHNDFTNSKWTEFLPEGHVSIENVLFAPLMIEGQTAGLLGLANKPGGFTEHDAKTASALGNIAAAALRNSRLLESLRNAEDRFRLVAQSAADAVISIDSDGKIIFWNKAAETIFGYTSREILGKPLSPIMQDGTYKAHQYGIKRLISSGKPKIIGKTIEMTGRRKNGSEFPVELSLSECGTREGIFFTGIVRDITERKNAEKMHTMLTRALGQERDILHTIMENTGAHLVYLDPEFNFILVNSAYEKGSGHTREELLGRNHFDFFPSEENEAIFKKVRDTGESVEFKARPFEFADQPWRGTTYWDWTLTPVKDTEGKVKGLVFSLADITEKVISKQLSDALNNINLLVASTLDFDEITQKAVVESAKVIGAETSAICLLENGKWVLKYLYGFPTSMIGMKFSSRDMPHAVLAAKTKKPVVIENSSSDERVNREMLMHYNIRSVMVLPLMIKEKVIGTLFFNHHTSPAAFSESHIDFANKLATSISLALENARLYEKSLSRVKTFESVIQMGSLITSSLTTEEVHGQIVNYSLLLLNAQAAILLKLDNKHHMFRVAASSGVSEKISKSCLTFAKAIDMGFIRQAPSFIKNLKNLPKIPVFSESIKEGFLSAILTPVIVSGELHSLLLILDKKYLSPSEEDTAAMKLFANQSAIAIKNAERYEAEHYIAQTLQKSLLHSVIPRIKDLEFKFYYQSASKGAEVGGDFYDFFEIDEDNYGIVMGDVSGKGVDVAAETARIKFLLQDRAHSGLPPSKVLASVNNTMIKQKADRFTALTYGVYNRKASVLNLANAGNPYPYMAGDDSFLKLTDVPISIIEKESYNSMEIPLQTDDLIIMYTDGLIEARYKDTLFGEEKVRRFVKKNKKIALKDFLKALVEEARRFSHDNLKDDILVIGIRKR